jgi:hypothetical protein
MQLFKDQMYMMNPLDTLDFTMHAPIDWNSQARRTSTSSTST